MPYDHLFVDAKSIPPRRSVRRDKPARPADDFKDKEPVFELDSSFHPPSGQPAFSLEPPDNLTAVLAQADGAAGAKSSLEPDLPVGSSDQPASPQLADVAGDPLTQAIFGWREEELPLHLKPPQPELVKEISKETILAELSNIESEDSRLVKKIIRVSPPRRRAHLALVHDPPTPARARRAAQAGWQQLRANEDWFGVTLAQEAPALLSLPARPERSWFKIFLAGLAAVLLPLAAAAIFFGSSVFERGGIKSLVPAKFLSSANFTLVNTQTLSNFPYLAQLRNKISDPAQLGAAAAPAGRDLAALVDAFFEKNSEFSWLNIFKKKVFSNAAFTLSGLELLQQLRVNLAELKTNPAQQLLPGLDKYLGWLGFWQSFTAPDRHYVVVSGDEAVARPAGGRPLNYTIVKTTKSGWQTLSSGKFSAVDAALGAKIIPPAPLQTVSTAWTAQEAGWFFNFSDSAKALLSFLGGLVPVKADGLIFATTGVLEELSFQNGLAVDFELTDWFENLAEALARQQNQKWAGLAAVLQKAVMAHRLQFYFSDEGLNGFAAQERWAVVLSRQENEDTLGWAIATLKGKSPRLEAAEYKNQIFEDGSMVAKINLFFNQNTPDDSKNYLKIYLPQHSRILGLAGFSAKEKIPEFDYAAHGFSESPQLAASEFRPAPAEYSRQVDFYRESDFLVVGGWLSFKPQARNTVSLEYVLPFNLSRQTSLAHYRLGLWRPHGVDNPLFRFSLVVPKTAQILSLEPEGFVTPQLAEYQANLSGDLVLEASLKFSDQSP